MSKREENPERRRHTDEFRRNAVLMVESQGYTAARELGIHENLLRTWRKKYRKSAAASGLLLEHRPPRGHSRPGA